MRASSLFVALAVTAGAVVGLTRAAAADDGWYVSAGVGATDLPDLKASNTIAGGNPTKIEPSLGIAIVGAAGYAWGPVRLEEELGWRDNGIDKVSTPSLGKQNGTGDLAPLSLMTNLYYDFDTGSKWTPYLGAGAGGVDLDARVVEAGTTLVKAERIGFGYQGIAGLAYRINDALSIKADYRYLATTPISFPDDPALGSGKAKLTYESHAVLVGFVYHFGAAPKPAPAPEPAPKPAAATAPAPEPPPPAPVQPHQFLVFFDFDKADITPEARQIIEQAASVAKSDKSARIDLTGHTDLAGPANYNMKLSVRRAEAVKKVLVELGIGADEIGVVGKGKTEPLVPTADGVREPKNRRVEIVLPTAPGS
jgi:OOP family OmpA-OmpF porin